MSKFLLVLVAIFGLASQAEAGFNMCNYSSKIVDIAYAFEHPQQPGNWVSAGWKRLGSGNCQTLINYDLSKMNQNFYFYGISLDGQTQYTGRQNFCIVRGQAFTVFNANVNCNGGEFIPMILVNTGYNKDHTQNLVD